MLDNIERLLHSFSLSLSGDPKPRVTIMQQTHITWNRFFLSDVAATEKRGGNEGVIMC